MEQKNLDIYGHAPIPWSRARDLLEGLKEEVGPPSSSWFLTTASASGRPHVAGIGALWIDEKLWFVSGPTTRKSRDVAANPKVVLAVSLKSLDLVIDGRAARVTDAKTLERIAEAYRAQGWPASVAGDAFTAEYSAPSAGRPPWYLYMVTPVTAVGVATAEPHGATRWRF